MFPLAFGVPLSAFILMCACDTAALPESGIADLQSAVAVSKLVLAQQALFFKELINATRERANCCQPQVRTAGEVKCPYPYNDVMGECFYVSKFNLNWEQAVVHCEGMGGHLAIPKHIYGLKSYLLEDKQRSADVWIGAREGEETGWEWLDGSVVAPELFLGNPPARSARIKMCIELKKDRHPALSFRSCAGAIRFVCQLK